MASNTSNEGEDQPRSLLPPQSNAKAKRQRGKGKGHPELQFVTATHPSQFRGEDAKRCVASQAMKSYRSGPRNQKKKSLEPSQAAPVKREPITGERITPIMTCEHVCDVTMNKFASQVLQGPMEDPQYRYWSTSAAWLTANSSPSEHSVNAEGPDCYQPACRRPRYDPRYSRAPPATSNKVIRYEYSSYHEERQTRVLVGKLATYFRIGDGIDPFDVLPQFKNPELDSLYLLRKCMRAFSSEATNVKWLPALLSHPHLLLSSTILASTWCDMHAGCSGDSKRTTMVKAEMIGMVNERLRHPDTYLGDGTLVVILHLLAGEMWNCHEETLRLHESAVAILITQCGGMHCLGSPMVAEIAASCCYNCDIFCETEALPIFQNWKPPQYVPVDDTAAIPESPLFCPRADFVTITNNPNCSRFTYELLCDMRDLTDIFITYHACSDTIYTVNMDEIGRLDSSAVDCNTKVTGIRERLASLPSAYTPGLPTSNDWVYEACRITALIYTASIIMRVPFSVAADPNQNIFFSDSRVLATSNTDGRLLTICLSEVLYGVLERTDTANVWNDMSGVLYWICAVGAAAARTPAANSMAQHPGSCREEYTIWVRRCLIMFGIRTAIILIFYHPAPLIIAQKRLLKVQELISISNARALAVCGSL